jgi:hypothetical protein
MIQTNFVLIYRYIAFMSFKYLVLPWLNCISVNCMSFFTQLCLGLPIKYWSKFILDFFSDFWISSHCTRLQIKIQIPCSIIKCRNIPAAPVYGGYIFSVDPILQNLCFLSGFPWFRVATNKEATEPRVPSS